MNGPKSGSSSRMGHFMAFSERNSIRRSFSLGTRFTRKSMSSPCRRPTRYVLPLSSFRTRSTRSTWFASTAVRNSVWEISLARFGSGFISLIARNDAAITTKTIHPPRPFGTRAALGTDRGFLVADGASFARFLSCSSDMEGSIAKKRPLCRKIGTRTIHVRLSRIDVTRCGRPRSA